MNRNSKKNRGIIEKKNHWGGACGPLDPRMRDPDFLCLPASQILSRAGTAKDDFLKFYSLSSLIRLSH
jgi:hypothetical protein